MSGSFAAVLDIRLTRNNNDNNNKSKTKEGLWLTKKIAMESFK